MTYKLAPLTQGMAEQVSEALPEGDLSIIRLQALFVAAAITCGWITFDPPVTTTADLPRAEVVAAYTQLTQIWRDANAVPNA